MDVFGIIWRIGIPLLINCRPAGCYSISCEGNVTVDPGPVVRVGSNLTVLCQSNSNRCGRRFAIDLNDQELVQTIDCSSVAATVVGIGESKSVLLCRVQEMEGWLIVCELDVQAGYPPDKPTDFDCYTLRQAEYVHCTWKRGRVTYLLTKYTVTFESSSTFLVYETEERTHLSIPRSVLDENRDYHVRVRAQNTLGHSVSDAFVVSVRNCVIPSPPQIRGIKFTNSTGSVIVQWNSSEPTEQLRPTIRYRKPNDPAAAWTEADSARLVGGDFRPREVYEFAMRVCTTPGKPRCSFWSAAINITTPGKAPTRKLDVWRVVTQTSQSGLQLVTVLWQPLTSDAYRADLLRYELTFLDSNGRQAVDCPAMESHYDLQLFTEVTAINVSAVTSAGSSPPASVSLAREGFPAPRVRYLAPTAEGAVHLTWDWSHPKGILGYVVEWTHSPLQVQWRRVDADSNSTQIHTMLPGVRYNVSLYVESSRGVSEPAFRQIYAKEERPLAGPDVSVASQGKHILIQWEELPVESQRGFIVNYTIYIWRQGSPMQSHNKTPAHPRRLQLTSTLCGFDVSVSAWNSAGEGQRGRPATCQCSLQGGACVDTSLALKHQTISSADGMLAGVCFTAAIPIVILANLLYLKCARRRMRSACLFAGLSWLFENLPNLGNSNAINLLKDKQCVSDLCRTPVTSDPPLSPIEDLDPSSERKHSYPLVHGENTEEEPVSKPEWVDCPYRPQISDVSPKEEEEDVSQLELAEKHQRDPCRTLAPLDFRLIGGNPASNPGIPGLLDNCLCNVEIDGCQADLELPEDIFFPSDTPERGPWRTEADENFPETVVLFQSPYRGQTVLPNDFASCLRGNTFRDSPYTPQRGWTDDTQGLSHEA